MKVCKLCKSKMPDNLFVAMFVSGKYLIDHCPICTMTLRNIEHGIPVTTLPKGEVAAYLVDEAWQYYEPKGENIYELLK